MDCRNKLLFIGFILGLAVSWLILGSLYDRDIARAYQQGGKSVADSMVGEYEAGMEYGQILAIRKAYEVYRDNIWEDCGSALMNKKKQ